MEEVIPSSTESEAIDSFSILSETAEINVIPTTAEKTPFIPWIEDEWTPQDEKEASQLLNNALEQCRISPSKTHRDDEDIKAWDRFYRNHQTNFFKDRHYLSVTFPCEFTFDIVSIPTGTMIHRCLVEMGCGVGNALLPLLKNDSNASNPVDERIQWTVYGFDLSKNAIDILRKDPRYIEASLLERAKCDVCDISMPNVIPSYAHNVAHVTSLLFCLSAIHPSKHKTVLQNVAATLRPGEGVLIFRDYGRFDLAQIKLGTQPSKLLQDNFYRKHDGTKCYYFTVEDVEQLMEESGEFELLECKYIRRKYVNRSMQSERRRVWVQGRFRRKVQRTSIQSDVGKA
jgi:Methyltransferase domain